jgi:C4-dicarboxylate-specific signal transduction histidine kinase
VLIYVKDNGNGIPKNIVAKNLPTFFTTSQPDKGLD